MNGDFTEIPLNRIIKCALYCTFTFFVCFLLYTATEVMVLIPSISLSACPSVNILFQSQNCVIIADKLDWLTIQKSRFVTIKEQVLQLHLRFSKERYRDPVFCPSVCPFNCQPSSFASTLESVSKVQVDFSFTVRVRELILGKLECRHLFVTLTYYFIVY